MQVYYICFYVAWRTRHRDGALAVVSKPTKTLLAWNSWRLKNETTSGSGSDRHKHHRPCCSSPTIMALRFAPRPTDRHVFTRKVDLLCLSSLNVDLANAGTSGPAKFTIDNDKVSEMKPFVTRIVTRIRQLKFFQENVCPLDRIAFKHAHRNMECYTPCTSPRWIVMLHNPRHLYPIMLRC